MWLRCPMPKSGKLLKPFPLETVYESLSLGFGS